MTKREAEALDNTKRILQMAEAFAGMGKADDLIRIADRWLSIADRSRA